MLYSSREWDDNRSVEFSQYSNNNDSLALENINICHLLMILWELNHEY